MKAAENEYTKRADELLARLGVTVTITRIGQSLGFAGEASPKPGESDTRMMHDTYTARIERALEGSERVRSYTVPLYHQSAAHSESEILRLRKGSGDGSQCRAIVGRRACNGTFRHEKGCPGNPSRAESPSAYDILSALQWSDPGTFEDFCGEYGYDTDSRAAERTYFAVQAEWSGLRRLFSEEERGEFAEVAS